MQALDFLLARDAAQRRVDHRDLHEPAPDRLERLIPRRRARDGEASSNRAAQSLELEI